MKIAKTFRIKTKHYSLRIPIVEDIPHIYTATKYEGFNDGLLWDVPTSEDDLLEPFNNNIKFWEAGKKYTFTIERQGTTKLLGRIYLSKTKEEDIWNVGFWTHPAEQGKGIITEVLLAVLKFGFEELLAKQIDAYYVLWNKGSEKVLIKNGFKFVKLIKKGFKKNGMLFDGNRFAISREMWINDKTKQ